MRGWRAFPVDAKPRAVVMVGGGVQRPPAQTDAETHRVQIGSYRVAIKLSRSRVRRDGYQVISAAAAAHKLRMLTPGKAARRPALMVDGVSLGRGWFPTDRPDIRYPEWLFSVGGAATPTRVIAAPIFRPPATFRPRQVGQALLVTPEATSAVVLGSGRRLRLEFTGGSPGDGPCDVNYTARAFSSRAAVAYAILPHPVPTKRACLAGAYEQSLAVTFPTPLRNRVLISAISGHATPVARHLEQGVARRAEPSDP